LSSEIVFLVLAALVAVSTALAVVAPRRPALLGFIAWMVGLVPNEVPFVCIGCSVILVAVFGFLGVFGSSLGVAGAVVLGLALVGQVVLVRRSAVTGVAVQEALDAAIGPADPASARRNRVPLGPVLLKPFYARRRDVERIADIAYGEHGVRNMLDVYVRRDRPQHAPVLVHLHGGAWVTGKKNRQGLPLIYHLAHAGWLCVAPNYRLGPAATFPDQLIDVKRVLAWVQDHAAEHGGDPTTVFLAGGSAGGHLSALAALTANDPALQPGFEEADTRVAAAIPLYGDYDWLDTHRERERRGLGRMKFLTDRVVKCTAEENRALWESGSPLYHVRPDAPPFFMVHGSHDTMLLVEDTRHFVEQLRSTSAKPVAYAELPGGQHAFDGFQSVRCGHVINGIERFTAWVRSNRETVPGP